MIATTPVAAQKTDILVLDNGDRITCEIKQLEYGVLQVKTDSIGTLSVKWEHVDALTSDKGLQIEIDTGEHYFGSLTEPSAVRKLRITSLTESTELDMYRVVRLRPINQGFFKRMDGSLDLGFSFTKSSEVTQLNLNGSTTYRTRKRSVTLKLDSIITSQVEVPTSRRNELLLTVVRFYQNKWFTRADTAANQNDELGIKLRTSLGLGGGRFLKQTDHQVMQASLLLVGNHEAQTEGSGTNNLEINIEVEHRVFRLDSPKTDLTTTLSVSPSLTNSERVRVNFSINLRQELIKDFFWNLNGYYDYDSDPGESAQSKDDYGIVTSFGWSF